MNVFTNEPGQDGGWADWVSMGLGTIAGLIAIVVLGSEVAFRLLVGFEFIEVEAATLWGLWRSVFVFTACGLVSAAFLAGSPVELGRRTLEAMVGKIGGGEG